MPHQCTGCGHTFEDGSKEMLSGCPDCGGNKFQFRPASASATATATASGSKPASESESERAAEPEPSQGTSSVAETVGRATTKVRDFVSAGPDPEPGSDLDPEFDSNSDSDPDPNAEWPDDAESVPDDAESTLNDSVASDDDIIDADARANARAGDETEDIAQASARSDVVSESELSSAADDPDDAGRGDPADADDAASAIPGGEPTTDGRVVSEPSGDEPDMAELREQLNDQFESIKILEPGQYELNLMELYDREEYIIALQENGRYVIQVPDQWIGEDVDDR